MTPPGPGRLEVDEPDRLVDEGWHRWAGTCDDEPLVAAFATLR
jgi:hypothetical protein